MARWCWVTAVLLWVALCDGATASTGLHSLKARIPAVPLAHRPYRQRPARDIEPVLLERATTQVETGTRVMVGAGAEAALGALGTVAISADADAEQELILQDPGVKAALAAKTPDAVDKLIQGILDGTGQGGVVTSEFNQNGVHATIISNVNELRITQVADESEQRGKAAAEADRKQAIVEKARSTSSSSSAGSGSDSSGSSESSELSSEGSEAASSGSSGSSQSQPQSQ